MTGPTHEEICTDLLQRIMELEAHLDNRDGTIKRLLKERAEAEAENARLWKALRAWVRHYEQTAPDDANPSDPEWVLWKNARTALQPKGDE